jgi:hypothetical protein
MYVRALYVLAKIKEKKGRVLPSTPCVGTMSLQCIRRTIPSQEEFLENSCCVTNTQYKHLESEGRTRIVKMCTRGSVNIKTLSDSSSLGTARQKESEKPAIKD